MIDRDELTLTVNGNTYRFWTGLTLDRRIEHMATHLDIACAENWGANAAPWQLRKFDKFTVAFGQDLIMTGYIDEYEPDISETAHRVSIIGRSKTGQLIDCSPDISGGQFRGYAVGPIARAVCQPFGINVVDQVQSAITFPDATLQRSETAFTFIQRLARLSSVLPTDDEHGQLVLTRAGASRASGSLVMGVNVKRAKGHISAQHQFSIYIVIGQHAIGSAAASSGLGDGDSGPAPTPVATQMRAVATDPSVPLYRPHVKLAEAQLSQAGMQARANWERNYGYGRSTQADLTVVGWRQPDGTFWKINQIVPVTVPQLEIDQDLLVIGTKFTIDAKMGRLTVITVAPIEGYTPEPGQVKSHTKKGKKGSHFESGLGDA